MAGEGDERLGKAKTEKAEIRCWCGALVARRVAGVVELYCRRCKRVVAFAGARPSAKAGR